MTDKQVSEVLDDITKYFGRCYINAANGSRAKDLFKKYMAVSSYAAHRIWNQRKERNAKNADD